MPETWDRQPGEPERGYDAFLVFRDMGPDRTVPAAYRRAHPGQRSGNDRATQAAGQWNRWSKAHDWRRRAMAWDHHTSAVAQRAADRVTEETAEKWARRRDAQDDADYAFSQKYAGEVAQRLNRKDAQGRSLPPLTIRDLKDAIAVTAAASQLARAAIQSQLPDPDADFNPLTATNAELRDFLDRAARRGGLRVAAPA